MRAISRAPWSRSDPAARRAKANDVFASRAARGASQRPAERANRVNATEAVAANAATAAADNAVALPNAMPPWRTAGHCSRAAPAPARADARARGAPYAHIAVAELAVVRAARRP
jgi:hypothetical protein